MGPNTDAILKQVRKHLPSIVAEYTKLRRTPVNIGKGVDTVLLGDWHGPHQPMAAVDEENHFILLIVNNSVMVRFQARHDCVKGSWFYPVKDVADAIVKAWESTSICE